MVASIFIHMFVVKIKIRLHNATDFKLIIQEQTLNFNLNSIVL